MERNYLSSHPKLQLLLLEGSEARADFGAGWVRNISAPPPPRDSPLCPNPSASSLGPFAPLRSLSLLSAQRRVNRPRWGSSESGVTVGCLFCTTGGQNGGRGWELPWTAPFEAGPSPHQVEL